MKKIAILLTIFTLFVLPIALMGQNVPPPPTDAGPRDGNNQTGASAPIGGGVAMLLTMGAAYGGKKYFDYRKKLNNEMED